MAIAFGAAGNGGGAGTTPTSGSITVSGTGTIGVAVFFSNNNTNPVNMVLSSPTWNGSAMTLVGSRNAIWDGATQFASWTYIIASPTTGTVTASISNAANSYVVAGYYTGCDTTALPETSNHNESQATSLSTSVTTTTNNDWLVMGCYATGDSMSNTAGTVRASQIANRIWIADDGPKSPAGSYSMGASGQSGAYAILQNVVALKPSGYTLTLDQGSFTLTGQTISLKRGLILTMAQGSYALTGQTLGLLRGLKLAMTQGLYTLSGQVASLVFRGWTRPTKNDNTWTFSNTKNSNSWSNPSKNSNSWTFPTKN